MSQFKHRNETVSDAQETFETLRATRQALSQHKAGVEAISAIRKHISSEILAASLSEEEVHVNPMAQTSRMLPAMHTVTMPTEKVEKRA